MEPVHTLTRHNLWCMVRSWWHHAKRQNMEAPITPHLLPELPSSILIRIISLKTRRKVWKSWQRSLQDSEHCRSSCWIDCCRVDFNGLPRNPVQVKVGQSPGFGCQSYHKNTDYVDAKTSLDLQRRKNKNDLNLNDPSKTIVIGFNPVISITQLHHWKIIAKILRIVGP